MGGVGHGHLFAASQDRVKERSEDYHKVPGTLYLSCVSVYVTGWSRV